MTYKKDFWEELTSCIDNLVEKGEIIKKVSEDEAYDALIKEIDSLR